MDIKEKILVALGLNKEDEVKLAFQAKTEDGTIIVSTAEELESGVDISVLTEDGTTIPLPAGTYRLDTGISFRVENEGIVSEVIESETEEDVTEEELSTEELEDKKDKDKYAEEFPETPAEKADWAKTYEELKDKVDNLMDAVADIKARMGETETEEVEMAEEKTEEVIEEVTENKETPKTVTTKTTEVVEFSKEDYDKIKTENDRLKAELDKTPADTPINTNKFSSDKPALSRKEYNRLSGKDKFLYDLNK